MGRDTSAAAVVATATVVARTLGALALYALSHLVPSRRGLWVFGADAGDRFAGNPKYAFLHATGERPDVRAVWVADDPSIVRTLRDAGYEAHRARSLRGIALTALAEYVVVSHGPADATWWATGGSAVVQLWHGVPLKRIGDLLDREWSLAGRLFFRLTGSRWDRLVTTGSAVAPVFASAYHVDPEDVLPVGYPRNDVLRGSVPDATVGMSDEILAEVRAAAEEGPIAMYVPTWRDWGDGVDHGAQSVGEAVDFDALEAAFADRAATLLVKLHPRDRDAVDFSSYDHVREVPAAADPYPLLEYVDVLATDYSSMYFDFLLTDRPVVFYPFDLAAYREDPGFALDYDELTPGPAPTDFESFAEELLGALNGAPDYADERAAVRESVIDAPDRMASDRLCATLAGDPSVDGSPPPVEGAAGTD